MILVAALMIGFGVMGVLKKKTLLSFLISVQFLSLGSAQLFLAGRGPGGFSVGVIVVIGTTLYTVAILALSIRLHYLKPGVKLSDLRNLKR